MTAIHQKATEWLTRGLKTPMHQDQYVYEAGFASRYAQDCGDKEGNYMTADGEYRFSTRGMTKRFSMIEVGFTQTEESLLSALKQWINGTKNIHSAVGLFIEEKPRWQTPEMAVTEHDFQELEKMDTDAIRRMNPDASRGPIMIHNHVFAQRLESAYLIVYTRDESSVEGLRQSRKCHVRLGLYLCHSQIEFTNNSLFGRQVLKPNAVPTGKFTLRLSELCHPTAYTHNAVFFDKELAGLQDCLFNALCEEAYERYKHKILTDRRKERELKVEDAQ